MMSVQQREELILLRLKTHLRIYILCMITRYHYALSSVVLKRFRAYSVAAAAEGSHHSSCNSSNRDKHSSSSPQSATQLMSERCDVYSTRIDENGTLHLFLPDGDNQSIPIPTLTTKTSTSLTGTTDPVPATVLQYERQMRMANAAKKAKATVTKEEHLKVIYKDEHLVVTDKPSGVLCVPGINHNPNLASVVHQEFAPTIDPIDKIVVHRLDMDTSGLVIFARTLEAVTKLHEIFRARKVEKLYEALLCGHVMSDSGRIDLPLQRDHDRPPFMRVSTPSSEHDAVRVVQDLQHHGWKKIMQRKPKPSQTEFTVLRHEMLDDRFPVTRVALKPITGRTHQLRVHCAALGHPIVGDPTYGIYGEATANGGIPEHRMDTISPHRASLELQKQINALNVEKMCLHAKELSMKHFSTGEPMHWEANTPF